MNIETKSPPAHSGEENKQRHRSSSYKKRNYEIRTPAQWKRMFTLQHSCSGRLRQCCLIFRASHASHNACRTALLSLMCCSLPRPQRASPPALTSLISPQRLCFLVAARLLEVDRFVHLNVSCGTQPSILAPRRLGRWLDKLNASPQLSSPLAAVVKSFGRFLIETSHHDRFVPAFET